MKTIITITDMPDGSVNIDYMTQRTTAEIAEHFNPEHSRSYKTAAMFAEVVESAKALNAEIEKMAAEKSLKTGAMPCLH